MRVLAVHPGPSFSVADVFDGWVKGLSAAGCDVVTLNLDDRLEFYEKASLSKDGGPYEKAFTTEEAIAHACKGLETACYEWWPDVVVITSGFYVPRFCYDLMRSRGHKVVLVHTESPYEDDRQIGRASWADVNIVNDPTNLHQFQQVNPNSFYFPHAYDPDIHHPGGTPDVDVSFVGTGYPSRTALLESVDWSGLDVVVAGNWQDLEDSSPLRPFVEHDLAECLPNTETADLYRRTRVGLNIYRKDGITDGVGSADGWAMGPREVELAACGTFYLTEERGENREVLPMVPTFSGADDLSQKVRWWLDHPEARAEVAAKAQVAVADRTFHSNARRLLSLLA